MRRNARHFSLLVVTATASTLAAGAWSSGAGASSSYNIDFGAGPVPQSSYGGAALPGVWNQVGVLPSSQRQDLLNLEGVADGARIYMIGGSALLAFCFARTQGVRPVRLIRVR